MLKVVATRSLSPYELSSVLAYVDLSKKDDGAFVIKFITADTNSLVNESDGEERKFNIDCSAEFTPEEHFVKRSGVELYTLDGEIKFVTTRQQYTTRDGELLSGTTDNSKRIAALWFCDNPEQIVILLYKESVIGEGIEFENSNGEFSGPSTIAKYYPEMANFAKAAPLRRQILKDFDANSVLAYLEAQVDLLSLVVQAALCAQPDILEKIKHTLPVDDIFTAINDTNVTTVKSVESCLDEINTTKAKFRLAQKAYIDAKLGV